LAIGCWLFLEAEVFVATRLGTLKSEMREA